jgi:serine phosphatase RsbU (regulator of sigma subunit)
MDRKVCRGRHYVGVHTGIFAQGGTKFRASRFLNAMIASSTINIPIAPEAADIVLILPAAAGKAAAMEVGSFAVPVGRRLRPFRFVAFYREGAIRHLFEAVAGPLGPYQLASCTELVAIAPHQKLDPAVSYVVYSVKWVQAVGPVVSDQRNSRGRPSHFTYGQPRYTTYGRVSKAKTTSELVVEELSAKRYRADKSYIQGLKAMNMPVPRNEEARIDKLYSYDLLDTNPEEEFDNLVRMASSIAGTPIALISLIDGERQWFKSKVGLGADETPREISFCQYAIMENEVFEVKNSLQDERFVNNPLVADPDGLGIRFYAGAPLTTPDGFNIGTLCVIDTQPRELTDDQRNLLTFISKEVVSRFELRRRNSDLLETNKALEDTLTQLSDLQDSLEESNRDMNDSLVYASRMQQAVLPSDEEIRRIVGRAFKIYLPKNIVSGDFYWLFERRGKIFVALADCTGHGVPGALMSFISQSSLSKLAEERGIVDPAYLMEELDGDIARALRQQPGSNASGMTQRDGLDISLAVIDRARGEITYGAANSTFFHVRGSEVTELRGEKLSLGGGEGVKSFLSHRMEVKAGDRLYFATDGFADQFGGPEVRKFSNRRLRELITEVQSHPFESQEEVFSKAIHEWKGNTDQTDDISLLAIEI